MVNEISHADFGSCVVDRNYGSLRVWSNSSGLLDWLIRERQGGVAVIELNRKDKSNQKMFHPLEEGTSLSCFPPTV